MTFSMEVEPLVETVPLSALPESAGVSFFSSVVAEEAAEAPPLLESVLPLEPQEARAKTMARASIRLSTFFIVFFYLVSNFRLCFPSTSAIKPHPSKI